MQCQIGEHKIQDCQQKIEETWSFAREEAAKCKAAKEIIKALAIRVILLFLLLHGVMKIFVLQLVKDLHLIRGFHKHGRGSNIELLFISSNTPLVLLSFFFFFLR